MSNCASVLNGNYQRISVRTPSSNSTLYVDSDPVGKGKVIEAKVKRDLRVHQLRLETEGFKPEYKVVFQSKKSPLHIISWVPFGIFFFPPFGDQGPKSWDYSKEINIKPTIGIARRSEKQKYIYLQATSFDVKKQDLKVEHFSNRRYNNKKKSTNVESSKEEIEISNSIFTDALHDILKSNGFVDTTNRVFRSKTNTMLVGAKVSKITFKRVASPLTMYNAYFVAEIVVEWTLQDIYEQPKYTKKITSSSGEFAANYQENSSDKSYLTDPVEDALSSSFSTFLKDAEVQKLITVDAVKKPALEQLKILSAADTKQDLLNAQAATVTVTSKKGHGSGCVVSASGYVITNYHVVAGATDLNVIFNSGEKHKVSVVRFNEETDIALLKIDNAPSTLAFFKLPSGRNYNVGDEVFAIGTPKSIELSQTLSKGIISALRKLPDNSQWIQTDVSTNSGNSGGALISKSGELIGIINSKLVGFGVEGISFCIPAESVRQALALE